MGDVNGDYDGGCGEEDERAHEWEAGLPNLDDLMPLTQGLIPPELLSAFDIRPEPSRTAGDVSRASHDTIRTIRGASSAAASNFKPFDESLNLEVVGVGEEDFDEDEAEEEGSDLKKARRNESPEDADSAAARALKRPRLVWTPQLHKRFVDVVAHLGIKNAVPKTIMQLMNVEGLTRENVASHLQKYRLYLKRMQGVGPSISSAATSTEQLFSSTPVPENGNGNGLMPIPMPYGPPMMPMMPMPMPMMGMGPGQMVTGMGMGNYNHHHHHHHNHNHYHHHHQYNGMMQSGNNKYGSVMAYHRHHHPPHVSPGDK